MLKGEHLKGVYCTFIGVLCCREFHQMNWEMSIAYYNGLMDFFTDKISIVFSLIRTSSSVLCRLYYCQMSYKFSVGHEMAMICMS